MINQTITYSSIPFRHPFLSTLLAMFFLPALSLGEWFDSVSGLISFSRAAKATKPATGQHLMEHLSGGCVDRVDNGTGGLMVLIAFIYGAEDGCYDTMTTNIFLHSIRFNGNCMNLLDSF